MGPKNMHNAHATLNKYFTKACIHAKNEIFFVFLNIFIFFVFFFFNYIVYKTCIHDVLKKLNIRV